MTVLVTGVAGFIGYHLADRLGREGIDVVGVDNLTPYYDVSLKHARLNELQRHSTVETLTLDLCDAEGLARLFADNDFRTVVNLAAQPGVRYSIDNPDAYIQSNLVGFANLLEACRQNPPRHLVFASTSSVYGAGRDLPYRESQVTDHPVSLYAATKKANEVLAHSYSHLYRLPMTGLRFFTVYGEWGRPDMAFFKFTDAILNDRPIEVYNEGRMSRDFTYVQDIIDGVRAVMDAVPAPDPDWRPEDPVPGTSGVAPYRILNIGSNRPVDLMSYIEVLENCLGRKAKIDFKPMQMGDVADTWADSGSLATLTGHKPETPVEVGLENFVRWYKRFYKLN